VATSGDFYVAIDNPKQMDELRETVSALELSVPWEAMALQG